MNRGIRSGPVAVRPGDGVSPQETRQRMRQKKRLRPGLINDQADLEIAPAAPQRADAGHAVALAPQVSPQASDPQHGLTQRRWPGVRRGPFAMDRDPKRAPFVLAEHRGARRFGFDPRQGTQLNDAHRDRQVDRQGLSQPLGGVELQGFDPAAAPDFAFAAPSFIVNAPVQLPLGFLHVQNDLPGLAGIRQGILERIHRLG